MAKNYINAKEEIIAELQILPQHTDGTFSFSPPRSVAIAPRFELKFSVSKLIVAMDSLDLDSLIPRDYIGSVVSINMSACQLTEKDIDHIIIRILPVLPSLNSINLSYIRLSHIAQVSVMSATHCSEVLMLYFYCVFV